MTTWVHGPSGGEIRGVGGWLTRQHLVARYLEQRGISHLEEGATRLAERALERSVTFAREAADWRLATRGQSRLLAVAVGQGRWGAADARATGLVELAEDSGSLRSLGVALRVRAELLANPGYASFRGPDAAYAEARATYEAAIEALEQVGDVIELGLALRAFACCLLSRGDRSRALAVVARAKRLIAH